MWSLPFLRVMLVQKVSVRESEWPAYVTEQRATLLFNEEYQVVNDPQGAECQVWKGNAASLL
jgi:carboxylesterase type B